MELLIRGAMVYMGGVLHRADVRLKKGIVTEVAADIAPGGERLLDAGGCVLAPGFTDLHVHLRQPGFEVKETIATGTAAAAAGGFTTVCAMPNLNPVPDRLHNLEPQLQAIAQSARIRVLPYGAVTVEEKGQCLGDIPVLADFVVGFSDDGKGVQDEKILRMAMEAVAAHGTFIAAHCEAETPLPCNGVCVQAGSFFAREHGFEGFSSESEWAEVERDIHLAGETGCPLHICHASTVKTFELVRKAKMLGLPVTLEVTPHNLLLTCDDISGDEARFKMNPPLRTKEDREAALVALLDGTVDAIATDHAPHTPAEKARGFSGSPPGVVGLETAFPVLYTKLVAPGILPLERLLDLMNKNPRRILGEEENRIVPGKPADFVLLDMQAVHIVEPEHFLSKGRATPFEGWELKGWPVCTFAQGELVYSRQDA